MGQLHEDINKFQVKSGRFSIFCINSSEISGDLAHENVISSHVKITCYHGYPMQTRARVWPEFVCKDAYILNKGLNLVLHGS